MHNDKLVLKDGTEIILESSQGMGALHVRAESISAACTLWEKVTAENLKQVTVLNSDGMTTGKYSDMILDHVEGVEHPDGTIQFTLSLREKSPVEMLSDRIGVVEDGQRTQDGAIDELGQTMSDIVEGSV